MGRSHSARRGCGCGYSGLFVRNHVESNGGGTVQSAAQIKRGNAGVVWGGTLFKLALWCGSWRGYSTRGYLEEASRESDTGDARSRARRDPVPPIRYSPARSGSSMISLSVQERFNSVLFRCIRRRMPYSFAVRTSSAVGRCVCVPVCSVIVSVCLAATLCAISWPWRSAVTIVGASGTRRRCCSMPRS